MWSKWTALIPADPPGANHRGILELVPVLKSNARIYQFLDTETH
jgi:hypothetical protein